MYRVEEVAARFGVHPDTVRRWLRAGRLRGVRLGGRKAGWRISEHEVRRFAREGARRAVTGAPTGGRGR